MASNVETDEAREERLRRRRERDRIRRQTETPEQRDARFNIINVLYLTDSFITFIIIMFFIGILLHLHSCTASYILTLAVVVILTKN